MNARTPSPFGAALRRWRTLRRMPQMGLALQAETTPRHVSFLETGRSRPTKSMVLRLSEALELPLSERNGLLQTAGFASAFPERALDDAILAPIRAVIDRLLTAHAPFPAFVMDRWYDILEANAAGSQLFLGGAAIDPDDPPNGIGMLFGPQRAMVRNWPELAWGIAGRLRREVERAGDDRRLAGILDDVLEALKDIPQLDPSCVPDAPVITTQFDVGGTILNTFSTLVHFGAAHDITVEGLRIELIYPADAASDALMRALIKG